MCGELIRTDKKFVNFSEEEMCVRLLQIFRFCVITSECSFIFHSVETREFFAYKNKS